MGVEGGFFDGQRREYVGLVLGDRGESGDGLRAVEGDSVMLDSTQSRQRALRREPQVACVQPGSHHAVQDQCNEADRRVCSNSIWQSVIDRPDLYFGLENAEAVNGHRIFPTRGNSNFPTRLGCFVVVRPDQSGFELFLEPVGVAADVERYRVV